MNGPVLLASEPPDTSRLTLVFTGDLMGHDSQIAAAWNEQDSTYDYRPCFRHVKPYIEQADIAIANLELTFGGPPYQGYPRFSSPDALAPALREAGIDVLLNANNHVLDRGKQGLLRTIQVMEENRFIHTGSFPAREKRDRQYPLLIEKNGILLGILNYTYGTNGLKEEDPVMVNKIDRDLIRLDLEKVRSADPDFVIVTIHWGREYERYQDKTQQDLAGFMLRHGAGAVIGSHPHVVQPVEITSDPADSAGVRLVAYSLGNFVSNQRERYRDGGIILELELEKTGKTRISDYSYLPVWVYRPWVQGKRRFEVVPAAISEEQKRSIGLSGADLQRLDQFSEETRTHLAGVRCSEFFRDFPIK